MRYLLIPADALEAARTAVARVPHDRVLSDADVSALSSALSRCVLTAEVLVSYATQLSGVPSRS